MRDRKIRLNPLQLLPWSTETRHSTVASQFMTAYQECGVMLTDLVPTASHRHDLFDERDRQKQSRLMKAVDAINSDYGAHGGARP